jgi:hypothetical protein
VTAVSRAGLAEDRRDWSRDEESVCRHAGDDRTGRNHRLLIWLKIAEGVDGEADYFREIVEQRADGTHGRGYDASAFRQKTGAHFARKCNCRHDAIESLCKLKLLENKHNRLRE